MQSLTQDVPTKAGKPTLVKTTTARRAVAAKTVDESQATARTASLAEPARQVAPAQTPATVARPNSNLTAVRVSGVAGSSYNGNGTSQNATGHNGLWNGGNRNGSTVPSPPQRPRNRVLASLPVDVWLRISPHIRHALLIPGQSLHGPGESVERVYFPNSGLVSLVMDSRDGSQVEVGVIGREGIVGALPALCGQATLGHAMVQIAGNACWIPATALREEFRRGGSLQDWLMRYIQVMTAQASQCALCNRLHTVEERLCRWLLMVRDRIGNDEIDITHEFIAHMLGARRSGVTVALGVLQQAGLIDLTRAHIMILNGEGLESNTCECYGLLRSQFATLNDGNVMAGKPIGVA